MNDARDEIRARLNIEDLVGEYVELKRTGRNFKALSPWTNERTPSFIVSPDKQIWHDFSSGKGGDIFSFIMEVEGLNFREALEFLARKTGVELAKFDSKKSQQIAEKKKRLAEILRVSANFFQHCLLRDSKALDYVFKQRKLSKQMVRDFKIGFAPNSKRSLVDFLIRKSFSVDEIRDAGLLNQYDGDIFRGRVVISLQDGSGEPIGFTGRLIDDQPNSPKYLNTPQTLLYDKSKHIFGLHLAKNEIRRQGFVVVVEGNMDVIASHQVGVANVVATAGTAMTERHLKEIARFSGDIRLCFDADEAGVKATERTIILAQKAGVDVSIVSLNQSAGEAKDPDELIQKSVELWLESIGNAQSAVDWLLDRYQEKLDLATAAGKRQFSTAALQLVEKLGDPVEKEHYLDEIARRIGTSRQSLLAKFSHQPKAKTYRSVKAEKISPQKDDFLYEDDLLALAIKDKNLAEKINQLPSGSLSTPERNQILEIIQTNDWQKLQQFDNYVKILLLKADERLGSIKESASAEMERLTQKVKIEHLKKQKNDLQEQLRDAEIEGNDKHATAILEKIMELTKEINSGKN